MSQQAVRTWRVQTLTFVFLSLSAQACAPAGGSGSGQVAGPSLALNANANGAAASTPASSSPGNSSNANSSNGNGAKDNSSNDNSAKDNSSNGNGAKDNSSNGNSSKDNSAAVASGTATSTSGNSAAALSAAPGQAQAAATPAALAAANMQSFIDTAYKSGAKVVTIPPGTYYLKAPGPGLAHLTFNGFKDFKINANNVLFIYTNQTSDGLVLNNCSNVSIDGLTVDYQTVGFSQGQIIGVDPHGMYLDVAVDPGYPSNLDDPNYFPAKSAVYTFSAATNQLKVGSVDIYPVGITRLSPTTFRYNLVNSTNNSAVGDLFATRGVFTEATRISSSSYVNLKNYTIYGGGFGILESMGDGHHSYANVTVTIGPTPSGAKRPRLLSTTSDAFHSDQVRNGPALSHCLFEGMTDDGLSIHGRYGMATEVKANTLTVATQWDNFFLVGDHVRVIAQNGTLKGSAVVTGAVARAAGYVPASPATVGDFTGSTYTQLTLDTSLQVVAGDLLMDADAGGKNFQLLNSIVRNNRARSALIKADGGTIVGNTFDGSSMHGLMIDPEIGWSEAGYVQTLTIENNTFTHIGRNGSEIYGAIRSNGQANNLGHRSVVIDGNTFVDNYGIDLNLRVLQGLTISNNNFNGKSPALQIPTTTLSATPVVSLDNTDRISISHNTFPANQMAVVIGQSVTNLTSDVGLTNVYQSSANFSPVQGASNWHYQIATLGQNNFTDLNSYSTTDGWWQTSAKNWAYGGFFAGGRVATGYMTDPVLTFVAPMSGLATINLAGGTVWMPNIVAGYSDGAVVSIMLNNAQIWPAAGTSALVTPGHPLSFAPLQVTLRAGDSLRFRTNMNKNSSSDDVYWDPIIALVPKPVTTTYQSSANFSGVQGGSVWRYQYATVGRTDYTDFNNYSIYGWWKDSGRNWIYGGFFAGGRVDTGTNFDPVLTFVAPADGTATISLAGGTAYIPSSYAGYTDGASLSLTVNDRQLWPATGWAYVAPNQPVMFTPLQVSLKAGDRLYFRTNKYLYASSDDVFWDPIVAFTY